MSLRGGRFKICSRFWAITFCFWHHLSLLDFLKQSGRDYTSQTRWRDMIRKISRLGGSLTPSAEKPAMIISRSALFAGGFWTKSAKMAAFRLMRYLIKCMILIASILSKLEQQPFQLPVCSGILNDIGTKKHNQRNFLILSSQITFFGSCLFHMC